MQTLKKRLIIIGMFALIGLTVQVGNAFALYSPRLSQQAAIIREHIRESQAQNGNGSVLEQIEQLKAYDKAKKETFDETGISGNARVAQEFISDTTINFLIQNPFDSLWMVFNRNGNEWISSCLRDDIWNMETLRDKVGAEMVKAYLLRDTLHGNLLMEDYKYLIGNLDLLRKYGSNPNAEIHATNAADELVTITSTKYFFGNDGTDPNYYKNVPGWISNETGCPESEFQTALQEVVNSWEVLKTLSSGQGTSWGSIKEMAQANASIRAKQWIRANQLSLTLGGEVGGRTESLVKGGGWDKFVGDVKTQWQIIKNMVGPVTPLLDVINNYQGPKNPDEAVGNKCRFFYQSDGYFRVCNADQLEQYNKCKENEKEAEDEYDIRCDRFRDAEESISIADKLNKQIALQQENADTLEDAKNAFTYSMTMDSVAEQNIYFMHEVLWDMNMNIKRGYEAVSREAGEGIPSLYRKVATLAAKQCPNKQK